MVLARFKSNLTKNFQPRPTIDLVFKTMLQNNNAALKSLITAVLQPESPIETVTILSPELLGPEISSKQSRLDLYVKLQDGTLIDLEMQSSREAQFIKRSVYYTFQMIGGELRQGNKYNKLPKFSALNSEENPLFSAWVQFLAAKSAQEIEEAGRAVPEIDQLIGELAKMSSKKEFVNELNKSEIDKIIAQRAQAEALSDAQAAGMQKGIEKGHAEATLAAVQKVLLKRLKLSPESVASRLSTLSATRLEALHEAALDFETPADFENWLKKND
ncbi:Rpn family recombination-promoting nuclease/putative transposase [bacterium]|nr:Rpn family recombination-promoting nuclease/putative transposase [bacterium]